MSIGGFNNRPNLTNRISDIVGSQAPGIFSARQNAKFMSGARTILKINHKIVGFAFGISWRITTENTPIYTVDDYLPVELVPQRVHVDGTISMLHIPGRSPGAELWQPDVLNFLFHKYITIEVRDSATDQLIFYTNKAVITSRSEDIRVDSLASIELTWKAIGYRDERMPSIDESKLDDIKNVKPEQPKKGLSLSDVAGKIMGAMDTAARAVNIAKAFKK